MESKRKKRKVLKVPSGTPAPKESPKLPNTADALVQFNGVMVEEMLASEVWREIIRPLIEESIASVSGRFTRGRYHHGQFTRESPGKSLEFLSGYQSALAELNNNILDFVVAKDNLLAKKKEEVKDDNAPLYNPFLEE